MKLRTKLIPLASVFATSATIAPALLTSCSASGMIDLTSGNYVPSTKKAVAEEYELSEDIALEKWVSAVNKNPQTLIDDMYWCNALKIKGWADLNSINVTSVKGQVKDVSVSYVTVNYEGKEERIPTVSMTFTFVVESNWYCNSNDKYHGGAYEGETLGSLYMPTSKYNQDNSVEGTMYASKAYESKWTNIPVGFFITDEGLDYDAAQKQWAESLDISFPTIASAWHIRPLVSALQYFDIDKLPWSYSVKYSGQDKFVYLSNGQQVTKNYASSLDRTFSSYDKLCAGPDSGGSSLVFNNGKTLLRSEIIDSYYLQDIKKAA